MNNQYVDYLALEDVKVGDEVSLVPRRGGVVLRRWGRPLDGIVIDDCKKGEMAKVMVSGSIPVFVADNIVHAGGARAVYLTGQDRLVKIKPRLIPRAVWRRIKAWYPAEIRIGGGDE